MYEVVLKIEPDNAVVLDNLAYLLMARGGDLDDALSKAQRAKQLQPDLSGISYTLGWIYMKKNLAEDAIETFKNLVSKEPNILTYRLSFGMAYWQKGDKAQALEQFREVLKYNPTQEEKDKILEVIGPSEFSVVDADRSQTTDLLVGSWINQDQKPDLTQVNVRRDGARILAHAWGACSSSDCDWGEEVVELRSGIGIVIWDQGFVTTKVQLIPQPNGRLKVDAFSEYRDHAGTGHTEFFTRQVAQKDDASAAAARALLRQVAELYRTLPVYYESVRTEIRKTGQRETRLVSRQKDYYLPPDRRRTEIDDALEPFVMLADGKSAWTIYTAANEYRVYPQGKNEGIFRSPDPIRGTPHITGHERFDGAACTVIQLKLAPWVTETYWIEDKGRLVRKRTVDVGGESHDEVVYPVVQLGGAMKAELFKYDPEAAHATARGLRSREAQLASIGKLAADFTLPDLNGRKVTLSNLRGKVVLLDFWATWCEPCRRALPDIEMLYQRLKDKGVVVLGVNNEPAETPRQYMAKQGYTFPTVVDAKETVVKLFHVEAWPTTIVIDREGKVAYYASGYEAEKLRKVLQGLGAW